MGLNVNSLASGETGQRRIILSIYDYVAYQTLHVFFMPSFVLLHHRFLSGVIIRFLLVMYCLSTKTLSERKTAKGE